MALVSNSDLETLVTTFYSDLPLLRVLDKYHQGEHNPPFIPKYANDEYRLITSRCYTNFMPQAVNIPTQTLFVDGFRTTNENEPAASADGPEWVAFQRSRCDSIQSAIYRGAFVFGYSLVVAARDLKTGKARIRGISALKSSAIYDDPANDIDPRVAMEVINDESETRVDKQTIHIPARARVWGETHEEIIEWTTNKNNKRSFRRVSSRLHGATACPATRFAASIDLEGRCIGIVEPLIQLQDRINQTVHDLLIAQVYTSFQVRTATGMAAAVKQVPIFERDAEGNIVYDAETGQPVVADWVDKIGDDGQPVLAETNLSAATMLVSESPDTHFGTLPGAPLEGFIASIELAVRHFATLSATPPHYMMGSVTNISADALQAAEIALKRKIDLFKVLFGEAWERVVNIAAEVDGRPSHDDQLETLWRDMEGQSFARMADALLKLKEIEVPAQGLWAMLPGMTAQTLKQWADLREEDPDQILSSAMQKGMEQVRSDGAQPSDPNAQQKNADPELE